MDNRIKTVIAAVVVGGAFWAYQMFSTGTLGVISEPDGAEVRVDGQLRGVTPVTRLELSTGNHQLEVTHSFYMPHVEDLHLRRAEHLQRTLKLKRGEGTYQFVSDPSGAWVEVDGTRVGRTPMSYTTASGPHVIAMGQEQEYIVEELHTVHHGQTLEVNFDLTIDPYGTVTVTTFPRHANIEFVGEDVEYAPRMRVQVGDYTLRVSAPGYVTQEFRYQVGYGDNLHEVNLQRDFGMLQVAVTPADAAVEVSYAEGGQPRSKTYTQAMQVPVGEVAVSASAPGYRSATRSIQLGSEGASISLQLEQMSAQ